MTCVMMSRILFADLHHERLSSVLAAMATTDASLESNLFCRGTCHLAKFSHRITSVDIESMGYRNLLEILASFPGLVVKKDEQALPVLGLYGLLSQTRIQVLIDGIRYNDPFDGSFFTNLPALSIDYIDVYYGPGGTWFGEGSLSGIIAVYTKSLPEVKHYGHFSSDFDVGGGFFAIMRKNRVRAAWFGDFSTLSITNKTPEFTSPHRFDLANFWTSGFLDARISNTAQAHVQFRTSLSKELFGHGYPYYDKITWLNEIHLVKKRAQKNTFDLFFSAGYFKGKKIIKSPRNSLEDRHKALRFELGTKFHTRPFEAHDLYFGLGAIFSGLIEGDHILREPYRRERMLFAKTPEVFARRLASYRASSGHVYGFIQDEWQIRTPLLFTVGSRLILPFESRQLSAELLPNIGVVLLPTNKLRFTVAFQTSMRTASFLEESDRRLMNAANDFAQSTRPTAHVPETSHSLETSIWYSDHLGETQFNTSLSFHISNIYDAIINQDAPNTDGKFEVVVAGIRSINEVNFKGGHSFSVGAFYTRALKKDFDHRGYARCHTGLFSISNTTCPALNEMPLLTLKSTMSFDLASIGAVNFATNFMGLSQVGKLVTEPFSNYEVAYISKPLKRNLVIFAKTNASFGGYRYQKILADTFMPASTRTADFLVMLGFHISI